MKSVVIFFKCFFGQHELEWFDEKLIFKTCKHCHIIIEEESDEE